MVEAGKKQGKFDREEVIKFLVMKGHETAGFRVDSKKRAILVDTRTGAPLALNENLIDQIARKIDLLSGKWVIFVRRECADEFWNKIKKLADQGRIWGAKISTPAYPLTPQGTHVVCVYTKNYFDESDVMKVRVILKEIGVKDRLSYKPDIYTVLGIYPDNKENFRLRRIMRYTS